MVFNGQETNVNSTMCIVPFFRIALDDLRHLFLYELNQMGGPSVYVHDGVDGWFTIVFNSATNSGLPITAMERALAPSVVQSASE